MNSFPHGSISDTQRMDWIESGGEVRRDLLASFYESDEVGWWTRGCGPNYKRPRYRTAREAIDAAIREEQGA